MFVANENQEKIGWKEGEGLGRENQGIVEPISAGDKMNKHGLGYEAVSTSNFVPQTHHIDINEFFPHEQVDRC